MMWILGAAVALVGLVIIILALQVEDWSRDLSVNTASTSAEADDELLRPLTVSLPPEETAELVRKAAASLSRWEEVASDRAGAESAISLHFVRTTPLMRFKDDILVTVQPHETGPNHEMDAPHVTAATVLMHSQSRVGKGDLGQNPRNIKELMRAIRAEL